MASRLKFYRVQKGDDIGDPQFWNRRFTDIDSRIVVVEETKADLDAVIDEGRTVFRTRVDEILVPLIQEVEDVAHLGALLTAHSSSEVAVDVGGHTFFVDEDHRRRFAPAAYLSAMATGNPSIAMSGALVTYDSATGELVLDIDQVVGAGTVADWTITVANTTDAARDAEAARQSRDATLGYRTQAEAFALSASADADVASARADQAVAANTGAQSAKTDAVAAAGAAASAAATAVGYLAGFLGTHTAPPATRADGSALQTGDWYFRSVVGPPQRFYVDYWDGSIWRSLTAASDTSVTSFAGRTGGVAPASGDYTTTLVTRVAGGGVTATTAEGAIVELKAGIDAEASARATAVSGRVSTATTVTGGGLATGGGALTANQVITVPKSTNAQAVAGTDDTTAMTPLRVKDAIGALVPAASTTVAGKSRLATTTEATTGTAVDIAVTPAGLKAATDAVKNALVNGAGAALDTFYELSAALGGDANFATTVAGQIGLKLDISATSAWARGGFINASDAAAARTYLGLGTAATQAASAFAAAAHGHAVADVTGLQTALDAKLPSASFTASAVLALVSTVDGSGSGLDADKVRGQTPTTFGLARLTDADAVSARSGLGLGSAALLTAGGAAGNAVQLDGSGRLPAVDGSQLVGAGAVKAWATFHWTGSAVVIDASLNVASIVRNAQGDYTVTVNTALANANYGVIGNYSGAGGHVPLPIVPRTSGAKGDAPTLKTTTQCRIWVDQYGTTAGLDPSGYGFIELVGG